MATDAVASRYAEAVFDSAKAAQQLDAVLDQLKAIGSLIHSQPDLQQLLRNPDVDPPDKVRVLDRLHGGLWAPLVKSFITMVIDRGRAEELPAIAEAFEAAVDADRGHLRVTVRSAHPLADDVVRRLRTHLEQRERKQVQMAVEVVPELIGGLQVVLGHRVIDGSIRRQLVNLKERLQTVRVH